MKEALRANYSEDEITKIAIVLEYVALDFFNRSMDVALRYGLQVKNNCKTIRLEKKNRLYIICYYLQDVSSMFKKLDKRNSNYGDFIQNHLPSPVGNSIRN